MFQCDTPQVWHSNISKFNLNKIVIFNIPCDIGDMYIKENITKFSDMKQFYAFQVGVDNLGHWWYRVNVLYSYRLVQ